MVQGAQSWRKVIEKNVYFMFTRRPRLVTLLLFFLCKLTMKRICEQLPEASHITYDFRTRSSDYMCALWILLFFASKHRALKDWNEFFFSSFEFAKFVFIYFIEPTRRSRTGCSSQNSLPEANLVGAFTSMNLIEFAKISFQIRNKFWKEFQSRHSCVPFYDSCTLTHP